MKFLPGQKLRVDEHVSADLELVNQARLGVYRPITVRLQELADQGSWHQRDYLLSTLMDGDPWNTYWLDNWLRACPNDPAPAILSVSILLHQAWSVRTSGRASEVSSEQFVKFHGMLEMASDQIASVQDRFSEDPSIWSIAVSHSKGLQLGFEHQLQLVNLASNSAGDGYVWRSSVYDAWSSWWGGSADLSWNFSVDSMRRFPGSRNALLPFYAAIRELTRERTDKELRMLQQSLPWALDYVTNAQTEFDQITGANAVIADLSGIDQEINYAAPFFKVANMRVDSAAWESWYDDSVPLEKRFLGIRKRCL